MFWAIISILIGIAVTTVGYHQSRSFVSNRLKFVDAVQAPFAPLAAGAVATIAAIPVVALLPLVGMGTAIGFGISVWLGVKAGVRDIRRQLGTGY